MSKFLKTAICASVGCFALASTAVAQSTESNPVTRSEPNPWLDCGIGAMIFPADNLEVGAAISNIIWDWGTTAVISAQSSPETCEGLSNVETAVFIQRTYATLEADVAKGYGENLDALFTMTGATDEAAFVSALRAEYAEVVAKGEQSPEALYYAAEAAARVS